MNYRSLLLLTTLLLPFIGNAQYYEENEKPTTVKKKQTSGNTKAYIGISLGPSLAMNTIAGTDFTELNNGFATSGLTIDLVNFGYKLSPRFVLLGKITGSSFLLDEDELLKGYMGVPPLQGDFTFELNKPWSFGAFMIGAAYSIPQDKFNFDLKFMVGNSNLSTPEYKVTYVSPSNNAAEITWLSSNTSAFAFSIGAQIHYHFTNKFLLMGSLDYIQSEYQITTGVNRNGTLGYSEWKQPFEAVSLTLGIAYKIKN